MFSTINAAGESFSIVDYFSFNKIDHNTQPCQVQERVENVSNLLWEDGMRHKMRVNNHSDEKLCEYDQNMVIWVFFRVCVEKNGDKV